MQYANNGEHAMAEKSKHRGGNEAYHLNTWERPTKNMSSTRFAGASLQTRHRADSIEERRP
jgi:hypothetical protein